MGCLRGVAVLPVLLMMTACTIVEANADTAGQTSRGADDHLMTESEMGNIVAAEVRSDEAKRELIRSVLSDPRIAEAVETFGLDLTDATDAVATLDGSELDEAARQAVPVRESLRGGDTVVIGCDRGHHRDHRASDRADHRGGGLISGPTHHVSLARG